MLLSAVRVLAFIIFIIQTSYLQQKSLVRPVSSHAIGNAMRQPHTDSTFLSIKISPGTPVAHQEEEVPLISQVPPASLPGIAPEIVAAANVALAEQSGEPYYITDHQEEGSSEDESHKKLDSEDEQLLDKFYDKTTQNNPDEENNLVQPQTKWQGNSKVPEHKIPSKVEGHDRISDRKKDQKSKPSMEESDGWFLDEEFARISEQMAKTFNLGDKLFKQVFGNDGLSFVDEPQSRRQPQQQASYSPTVRLLTSYNPVEQIKSDDSIDSSDSSKKSIRNPPNSIVGATIYGNHNKTELSLSSGSPLEAIKMHDDMMKEPPHDGKVRVRMYFHRATHDDAKLYGTGPWKYWGHGWGVEYGYDPKRGDRKDHYQKGYTIERAFGRDFCKDKLKCRKPDPEFFVNVRDGGKYSEEKI